MLKIPLCVSFFLQSVQLAIIEIYKVIFNVQVIICTLQPWHLLCSTFSLGFPYCNPTLRENPPLATWGSTGQPCGLSHRKRQSKTELLLIKTGLSQT